jgi:hypothetical protein
MLTTSSETRRRSSKLVSIMHDGEYFMSFLHKVHIMNAL